LWKGGRECVIEKRKSARSEISRGPRRGKEGKKRRGFFSWKGSEKGGKLKTGGWRKGERKGVPPGRGEKKSKIQKIPGGKKKGKKNSHWGGGGPKVKKKESLRQGKICLPKGGGEENGKAKLHSFSKGGKEKFAAFKKEGKKRGEKLRFTGGEKVPKKGKKGDRAWGSCLF